MEEDAARAISSLVHEGGSLLVTASPANARVVGPFLKEADLELGMTLLGNAQEPEPVAHGFADLPPRFVEPWGIETGPRAVTLASIGGLAVAARGPVGSGSVILIADPRFLENGNMDVTRGGNAGVHMFLYDILRAAGVRVDPRVAPK
jgi:hypothetical protein